MTDVLRATHHHSAVPRSLAYYGEDVSDDDADDNVGIIRRPAPSADAHPTSADLLARPQAGDEARREVFDEAFAKLVRQRLQTAFRKRAAELAAPADTTLAPERRFHGPSHAMHAQLFGVAEKWIARETEVYRQMGGLRMLDEILMDPIMAHQLRPVNAGDEIVYQSRQDVDGFTPVPSDFQREWLEFSMQLKGRRIYGPEWKSNQIAIKQRNNWTVQSNGLGGTMTGRKEGKSTAMAMDVIVTMFNIPSVEIALFSRTQKQARIILNMAKVLGNNHARAAEYKLEPYKDEIRITHLPTGNMRLCTAYSGDADVWPHARLACARLAAAKRGGRIGAVLLSRCVAVDLRGKATPCFSLLCSRALHAFFPFPLR